MGLMYEAGLRTDEVLSLKPRDVVLEEKRVEVLRGKGHKSRTVYFRSDELGLLLGRWKRARPRGEYLFPTIRSSAGKGDKIDARGFRITFKRYVDRAGLDPETVTPHILRHTCATEMMRRGVNLRVIQEALGHKNISTTQIYTHVYLQNQLQLSFWTPPCSLCLLNKASIGGVHYVSEPGQGRPHDLQNGRDRETSKMEPALCSKRSL
jgi:integrase/recombinase XerD